MAEGVDRGGGGRRAHMRVEASAAAGPRLETRTKTGEERTRLVAGPNGSLAWSSWPQDHISTVRECGTDPQRENPMKWGRIDIGGHQEKNRENCGKLQISIIPPGPAGGGALSDGHEGT